MPGITDSGPQVSNVLLGQMLVAAAGCAFAAANENPLGAEYWWGTMCVLAEIAGLDVMSLTWDEIRAARARAIARAAERGLQYPPPPVAGP